MLIRMFNVVCVPLLSGHRASIYDIKRNDRFKEFQGCKNKEFMHGSVYTFVGISCDTSDWPPPSNGQISSPCSSNSQVHSGTLCTVTCNNGFKIDGPSSSVCSSDGEWDPRTAANCRGKRTVLLGGSLAQVLD